MSGRAAVFLDRDGTLIDDSGYLADPAAVRMLPGAPEAVARLNRAGLAVVVATNQSGIARGILTEAAYQAVRRRVDERLAAAGARVDAHYHCPHHPEITGACECRKPGTLLYRRAAERLGLDLAASWWVGDRLRDVSPARALGGRGILVLTGAGADEAVRAHPGDLRIVPDLPAAVEAVLNPEGPDYFPRP